MGGFLSFLVGGALGAALGITLSRRRPAPPRKTFLPGEGVRERPLAPRVVETAEKQAAKPDSAWSPGPLAAERPAPAPVAAPPAAPAPVAAPAAWPTAEPSPAPAPAAAITPPVATPAAPSDEVSAPFAPYLESAGGVVAQPVGGEESYEPAGGEIVVQPVEAGEVDLREEQVPVESLPELRVEDILGEVSEIRVTPEILEEPVPGTGWSSSVVLEEESFERVLPVIPEEALPEEGPTVSEEAVGPAAGTELETQAVSAVPSPPAIEIPIAEDLRARIEATRRRIREELEKPFLVDSEIKGFRPAAQSPTTQALEEEERITSAVEVPAPVTEVATARQEPSGDTVAVYSVGPTLEAQASRDRVPAGPALEEPVAAEPLPVEPAIAGPASAAPAPIGPAPAEPSSAEAPFGEFAAPPRAGSSPAVASEADSGPRVDPDYEAIKARIELTRSRLKAKAFDALMAGEAALLSRDTSGARPRPVRVEGIDGEIEHTVETTLREQED